MFLFLLMVGERNLGIRFNLTRAVIIEQSNLDFIKLKSSPDFIMTPNRSNQGEVVRPSVAINVEKQFLINNK